MGPRTVVHEHRGNEETPSQSSQQSPSFISSNNDLNSNFNNQECLNESSQFQQCLQSNSGNLSSCQFLFDALNQCQRAFRDNQQWKTTA